MRCANCNKDFVAKRKTAKFCSDKCRVYFSRVKDVTEILRAAPIPSENRIVSDTMIEPLIGEAMWPDISQNDLINGKAYARGYAAYVASEPCKHGADPNMCKFKKPGKPCK